MKLNVRQKSNWLFAQITILGTLIIALFLGLFYKIYNFAFAALGNMALGKVQAACGCQIASSSGFNLFTGFVALSGIAIIISFLLAFSKIIISIIKTKKFIALQKINFIKNSTKLSQITSAIGIDGKVVEIHTNQPLIFCHGMLSPKIYVSSAVVATLHCAELRAALLHETHHLLMQEPIRLLCIKFISAFGFIPGIKNLTKKYLSFSEMAADELATNNFTEKNHLATAMAKILELEEKNIIQKELAVSYFSQITEERVLVLSDNTYQPTFTKEIAKTVLGLLAAGFIIFLFGANIKTQQVRAQETVAGSGCTDKLYAKTCGNAWTKCAGAIYHKENLTKDYTDCKRNYADYKNGDK